MIREILSDYLKKSKFCPVSDTDTPAGPALDLIKETRNPGFHPKKKAPEGAP